MWVSVLLLGAAEHLVSVLPAGAEPPPGAQHPAPPLMEMGGGGGRPL